jgi:hypothetical protein
MKGSCKDCKWFDDKARIEEGFGLCRYNPPSISYPHWSEVSEEEWCSFFKGVFTVWEVNDGTE